MILIIATLLAVIGCLVLWKVLSWKPWSQSRAAKQVKHRERVPGKLLADMPMHRRTWGVVDIADFESLLRSERSADPKSSFARDRRIYLELVADAPADSVREQRDLFRAWLEARRFLDSDRYFGGADLVRSWKLLVTAAVLFSFVVGAGHAGGVLLLLDQNGHVSATKAALATVGVQIFVTVLAAFLWCVRGLLRRLMGEFTSLRVSIARGVLPRLVGQSRRRKFTSFLEQLADLEQPYRKLVISHVVLGAQLCVMAMSLGLLASLELYHFLSEDIRFGWSMTHDVRAESVHRGVQLVASPWNAVSGAGVPSMDQVSESRLTRETSGRLVSAETSRAWATFLTLAIFTYGVLLRLGVVLLVGSRAMSAAQMPVMSGPPVDDLVRRMTTEAELKPELEAPPTKKLRSWWKFFGPKDSRAQGVDQTDSPTGCR